MDKYIERFVVGHGITFETNSKNEGAIAKCGAKWREISQELAVGSQQNQVFLFCGAKNNGKSSLIRHLVNEYNSSSDDKFVYYVDFDPGQPEMTTPGIVSAHLIRSTAHPLVSPTYLNLNQHEYLGKSCVGGLNMSVNPRLYIANCKFIFKKVLSHRSSQNDKSPIFINTMGFIRGIGLAILLDLIKLCCPTHLIVLDIENDPLRSICTDLTPQVVEETRPSFFDVRTPQKLKKLTYQCMRYNLQFVFVDSTSTATRNRVSQQLAYFALIPEALYKPLMQLQPKTLSLKRHAIHCVSSYPLKSNIIIEILNQSWVHLVKLRNNSTVTWLSLNDEKHASPNGCLDEVQSGLQNHVIENDENNVFQIAQDVGENEMLGCGIIVDIEISSGIISLITPLDQDTLDNKVDAIIKPLSMQVPREIADNNFASPFN